FIYHFLIQSVKEAIAGRDRPIRPFRRAVGAQKLPAPRQPRAAAFGLLYCLLDPRRDGGGYELHTGHTSSFEEPLLFGPQPLKLPLDHLAERGGHTDLNTGAVELLLRQ